MTKDADSITYTLPILAKDVNGTVMTGVTFAKTDDKIDNFELPFTGTFGGAAVEGIFNCYVPEVVSQQPR